MGIILTKIWLQCEESEGKRNLSHFCKIVQSQMKKEETVKLISAEGFEFLIHKDAAMVSQTIRNMLTSPGLPLSVDQSTF